MTFKHTKKWYFWAKWLAKIAGGIFAVLPALIATLINFPMMVTSNAESTISIPFVLAIMISLIVVLQIVIKSFKNNTLFAVAVVLAFITALFVGMYFMEKETIKGLAWVAGCGAVGTMIACACFKLHDLWDDLYKNCGEVYVK
jgi:hypothetical protein